jgi:hypothetical protein
VFPSDEPHPTDEPDAETGYQMLVEGDLDGALAVATQLEAVLAVTAVDDWNYGNLIHDLHIIRGKVYVARGDVNAACVELLCAGATPGSPQLDTFGPDLSLAWALLAAGQDAEVVHYLRSIAAFWTPDEPG